MLSPVKDAIAQTTEWNSTLKGATAQTVLAWALDTFGDRVAIATSLGAEDQVLADMLFREGLAPRAFTLDTGRWFPETFDILARTQARYGYPIAVYVPNARRVESMVGAHGVNLFRTSVEARKLCCEVRKLEPLRRALMDSSAWVTGLRREQSASRAETSVVQWDEANGLVKISPLVDWDEAAVWEYIRAHEVPYSPLHDIGYPTIGCAPCTRAIESGEDPRSGRWSWEKGVPSECGLHTRTPQTAGHAGASGI